MGQKTHSSTFPKLDRSFRVFAEKEAWGTEWTNGTTAQPCRNAFTSQGWHRMEACHWLSSDVSTFQVPVPAPLKESIVDMSGQDLERLLCILRAPLLQGHRLAQRLVQSRP
jgi:hypothetical protein